MNTLWFAFIIYILGMGVVLYVRPSLMFDGGAWKEFGLTKTNNNTTIFPFWMFVILWSIASYVVGTLCVLGFSAVATPEGVADVNDSPPPQEKEVAVVSERPLLDFHEITEATQEMNEDMAGPTLEALLGAPNKHRKRPSAPPARNRKQKKRIPGYYVKGMMNGKPTYVYYGKQSPFDEE